MGRTDSRSRLIGYRAGPLDNCGFPAPRRGEGPAGSAGRLERAGVAGRDPTDASGSLIDFGWVAIRTGEERREKLVRLSAAGAAKLKETCPAWELAEERMWSRLPGGDWSGLLAILPVAVARSGNLSTVRRREIVLADPTYSLVAPEGEAPARADNRQGARSQP
jgi:hypothetical protein